MNAWLDRLVLACARHAIDRVDDGVVELFAGWPPSLAAPRRMPACAGTIPNANAPCSNARGGARIAAAWTATAWYR